MITYLEIGQKCGRDGLPCGEPLHRWGRALSFDLLDGDNMGIGGAIKNETPCPPWSLDPDGDYDYVKLIGLIAGIYRMVSMISPIYIVCGTRPLV